ncbi:hypothetical protein BT63DRAFT_237006 [Microthyrium microscopicum]|uniref:Zn(2)-C6 fungal-type domain-containing protein n=1 Tax=Microthyrium microscopicum TaxID=703497 RepID=A0A6A6UHM4_9PEZI|nr:hypothetical protein BT63DRAFT_237006 [Microthyrium microscopicum]
MAEHQSYPSPGEGVSRPEPGPFYGSASGPADTSQDVPQLELTDADKNQHQELLAGLEDHINPNLHHSGVQEGNLLVQHHPAQHIAREVMNLDHNEHVAQYATMSMDHASESDGPMGMAKPRSKVSRACDECRRKKIRCDATADNDAAACTACKKASMICQFSRTPQKRGPSKGYIKELADRVSSLEGALKYGGTDSLSGTQEDSTFIIENAFSAINATNKRTHSMSEGVSDHYSASGRTGFQPLENPNLHLDEGLASLYYQSIHPYLPFLPPTVQSLRDLVNSVQQSSRNALVAAMEATLRSVQYNGIVDNSGPTPAKADELLRLSIYNDQIGLAHLQALLFLAVDASNRGGQILEGGHGPRPRNFLAQAFEEARTLDLFNNVVIQRTDEGSLALPRSIAVCISVLDAFTYVANRKPGAKPTLGVPPTTLPGDKGRIENRLYWLGR